MSENKTPNSGFGRPNKDIGVNHISANHLTSGFISSLNHIDSSIVAIEKDIFDLQDIAYQHTEESINTLQDLSTVQNDLIELQYTQTLPWFCKSNFVHGLISDQDWNDSSIPNSSSQLFIRYVDLSDTFTGMFLFFPRVSNVGESRHAAMYGSDSETCVFVNNDPNETIRLNSTAIEWFPSSNNNNNNNSDDFLGHATLLAKPQRLGGYVFGSSAESSTPGGQSVIFPGAGAFYVQSLYIDNNSGHSKIVFIGQKFQSSNNTNLGSFSFYGLQ